MPWPSDIAWDAVQFEIYTDRELAGMLGVSVQAVNKQRRKRGARHPDPPIVWNNIELGERPDAEIAEELGVPIETVAWNRWRRGIPAVHGPRRKRRQHA